MTAENKINKPFAVILSTTVEAPEAVALTVLIRVTTLWFAVLLGIVALLRHRHH